MVDLNSVVLCLENSHFIVHRHKNTHESELSDWEFTLVEMINEERRGDSKGDDAREILEAAVE